MKKITVILTVMLLSVGLTVALTGCKKKSAPPTEPSSSEMDTMAEQAEDTADTMSEDIMETAGAAIEQAKAIAAEQTVCPVMGGKINKDVFVEYQGKKVYFCCPGCEDTFLKEPGKYISKLPQFQN
ncbi:MAG: YHS domain-containing protein [Phycisphaerae bacterium]|nr:YHS domain-containing protein [Phycisphaerae bacterium]